MQCSATIAAPTTIENRYAKINIQMIKLSVIALKEFKVEKNFRFRF